MTGDVLISGASIAGPALAYWLRRHGFNPTVVERAPASREGGYAIDIRGAALEVIERMGILPEVRRASVSMRGMSYVDSANRPVASVRGDLYAPADGGEDVEIMRGDLTRILHAATRQDTEYLFDDSITSLSQDRDGVRVGFERHEPRTFSLVVGADGLHSHVRALAFGAESRFIRHLGCYISIFSAANHLNLDHWTLLHNVPGKLAVIYSGRPREGGPQEGGPQEGGFQRAEAKVIFGFVSAPLHYDHRDRAAQQDILAAAFGTEGWEIPTLLGAMRTAPDFYFDSISQIRMDRWSNGRVVLLGDAGYCPSPASGQGTSVALVGAYVLAGELKADTDHHAALARYEHEIRGYVARNQRLARVAVKQFIPRTRPQIWLRNQLVRALPYLPGRDRLTGGVQRVAGAVILKDY